MYSATEDQQDLFQSLLEQQRLLYAMKVTQKEYQNAVLALLELAFKDCGGARFAAQVLLSIYDGDRWKADLAGICCGLDSYYFHSALLVLRGRALLMREPHAVIEDGEKRFKALAEDWDFLATPAPRAHA
ncbi:MAG: hypothetical protein R3F38_20315 [Gammaproteobacteria bacterium]